MGGSRLVSRLGSHKAERNEICISGKFWPHSHVVRKRIISNITMDADFENNVSCGDNWTCTTSSTWSQHGTLCSYSFPRSWQQTSNHRSIARLGFWNSTTQHITWDHHHPARKSLAAIVEPGTHAFDMFVYDISLFNHLWYRYLAQVLPVSVFH